GCLFRRLDHAKPAAGPCADEIDTSVSAAPLHDELDGLCDALDLVPDDARDLRILVVDHCERVTQWNGVEVHRPRVALLGQEATEIARRRNSAHARASNRRLGDPGVRCVSTSGIACSLGSRPGASPRPGVREAPRGNSQGKASCIGWATPPTSRQTNVAASTIAAPKSTQPTLSHSRRRIGSDMRTIALTAMRTSQRAHAWCCQLSANTRRIVNGTPHTRPRPSRLTGSKARNRMPSMAP